jgi:hypothetical protein
VFKNIAEGDHIKRSLLLLGELVEKTVVSIDPVPLGCKLPQCGGGFYAEGIPTSFSGQPQKHAHIATDIEEPPGALEALDQGEFLEIVWIPMMRGLAFKDKAGFFVVSFGIAPVDLLRRDYPGACIDERARFALRDTDRSVLGVDTSAFSATTERTRYADDLLGGIYILLGATSLVCLRLLD